jgi:predicted alpha/beta superfamily hydrolase
MRIMAAFLSTVLPACLLAQERPCKSTVTGRLEVLPLVSSTFHNTRNLRIWLPPGYDDPGNASQKYPVLYILDGASAFDACTAFLHDEMRADETLTELITAGRIPPLIAVAIDNASDIIGLDADGRNKDNGNARAREYLAYADTLASPAIKDFRGADLPEFFEHDVMPVVAARYRALTGGPNSALWGDSYAGAAALYLAIERPDLFDRMIIESPSLQAGNGRLLRDSVSLTNAPHRIALGIGTAEVLPSQFPDSSRFNTAWVRLMHRLADNLKAAAYVAPEVQLTIAEGGRHTTGDFGKRFGPGLLFIYASTRAEAVTPGNP